MPTSTRFAVAVHILSYLALDRKIAKTSDAIAASISTNPAVVRRLLGDLSRVGLTNSQLGKGGGARLAIGPKRITLLDIYRAVEAPEIIAMQRSTPSDEDIVGRNIQPVLKQAASTAEQAFFDALAGQTLKDILRSIKSLEAA
ncbi:MAG: Rrf2 family transcriptional regulator [Alphaproteobacteria bacterium]|nr:Rrf2 family transcriptional regulator [Alphaproteobacteria bacterium]